MWSISKESKREIERLDKEERKMLAILEAKNKTKSHSERAALARLDKSSCFICVWG